MLLFKLLLESERSYRIGLIFRASSHPCDRSLGLQAAFTIMALSTTILF